MLRWLSEGVRIDWLNQPPQPFHHGISRVLPEDKEWISSERDRCLLTGAWTRATSFEYVSRAFVVTHNGKRRLVFNLKYINSFCKKQGVQYGSLSILRRMMREDDWMWSIDLSDAYHHVGVHPSCQKYFTFAIETDCGVEYFSTSALNFGWTRSPDIFTAVMRPVVHFLRNPEVAGRHRAAVLSRLGFPSAPSASASPQHPMRVLPWLDDFAFFAQCPTYEEACSRRDYSYSVIDALGLSRNTTKGQRDPSHRLDEHLGFAIDSTAGEFQLTAKRLGKLAAGAHSLLQEAARSFRLIRARVVASFAGLAQASHLALPLARCWLRSLHDDLAAKRSWASRVRLSRQSLVDLRCFIGLRGSPRARRRIWLRPDSAVGFVDAGPYGWGGQLTQPPHPPVAGFWSREEAEIHITWRELRAVRLFIAEHVDALSGRRLLLHEDNQAVVAILASWTSRSPELMTELRRLLELLETSDISVRAIYIRSALNVVADHFSRIAQPHEYRISTACFHQLLEWWGPLSVDAFASEATAMLDRFWSEVPSPAAAAVDAFAQDWSRERVWAHPPPHLLPQLAQFLRERPVREALVCVPHWPGAFWFADLLEMSCEQVTLPAGTLQRVAFDAPPRLEQWPVTIFRIASGGIVPLDTG